MGTYVVTGSAGFIGSNVASMLLDRGDEVIGVDNFADTYDPRLKRWRHAGLIDRDGFHFIGADITQMEQLVPVFESQPEAVFNLAARAGVRSSVDNPWAYVDTNITGLLNLLEMCRSTGVGKFIQASTSSLYGDGDRVPFLESTDTSRPLSPYAATKGAAELMAATYHHLHGLDVSVLRFFTVYGPAGRPDMAPFRFVKWISEGTPVTLYGDGFQSRDFTYVDDIAKGVVAALRPVGYDVFNLGAGRPIKVLDLIKEIEKATDRTAILQQEDAHLSDVAITWADTTHSEEVLGWKPEIDVESGIKDTVDWYRENQSWVREVQV